MQYVFQVSFSIGSSYGQNDGLTMLFHLMARSTAVGEAGAFKHIFRVFYCWVFYPPPTCEQPRWAALSECRRVYLCGGRDEFVRESNRPGPEALWSAGQIDWKPNESRTQGCLWLGTRASSDWAWLNGSGHWLWWRSCCGPLGSESIGRQGVWHRSFLGYGEPLKEGEQAVH